VPQRRAAAPVPRQRRRPPGARARGGERRGQQTLRPAQPRHRERRRDLGVLQEVRAMTTRASRIAGLWRWARRVTGACTAVVLAGIASTPLWAPTIAAAACPGCYGMHQIAGDLFVDDSIPQNPRP